MKGAYPTVVRHALRSTVPIFLRLSPGFVPGVSTCFRFKTTSQAMPIASASTHFRFHFDKTAVIKTGDIRNRKVMELFRYLIYGPADRFSQNWGRPTTGTEPPAPNGDSRQTEKPNRPAHTRACCGSSPAETLLTGRFLSLLFN